MFRAIILKQPFSKLFLSLETEFNNLSFDGSLFVLIQTQYDNNGDVLFDFFDVIEKAKKVGYEYINTIVYPVQERQQSAFIDNVGYVVWLCKKRSDMYFCKDSIREKHIWKDVEWGKRTKNYNPLGKDPGNVWIPTKDDGKANITEHIMLSEEQVINKLFLMTDCENNYKTIIEDLPIVHLNFNVKKDAIQRASKYEGKVIFNSSENMNHVKNLSVSLAVTSPPYWDLKDYFKIGQIGQEPYEQYLNRMLAENLRLSCVQQDIILYNIL